MKIKSKRWGLLLLGMCLMLWIFPQCIVRAEEAQKYYLGEVTNTGKDNGYSEKHSIDKDDPHFGWKLGEFFVSGFTSKTEDAEGNPVFLKNVGDTITLDFTLLQDLNKLNGNDQLSICSDTNGYDKYFGVPQTNFKKGVLVIRHRDHQNRWGDPVVYTDFLKAGLSADADTTWQVYEEGDYEIALNYELKKSAFEILGWEPIVTYYNYRIFFRFSVRNGNCMVFPMDVVTGEELLNTKLTENGFRLDLAKSRYLDINVKREVLADGVNGTALDVRFNRPAAEGDLYTDEGIYTITVKNKYTGQETQKKIYVGTDSVLKAHVVTDLSISDIRGLLANGAVINKDGTININQITPEPDAPTSSAPSEPEPDQDSDASSQIPNEHKNPVSMQWIWIAVGCVIVAMALLLSAIMVAKKKKTVGEKHTGDGGEE